MILNIAAAIVFLFSMLYLLAGIRLLKKGAVLQATSHVSMSLVCFMMSALLGLVSLSIRGYQAFNYEETIATITVEPIDQNHFNAQLKYPDGKQESFKIDGNALYVDAHILKWKPIASLLGLHTSFQLSRVGGRYDSLKDEQSKPRSLYALSDETDLNLFHLRKRFSSLTYLVDAEYGSASFIPAKPTQYALKISTSGLLFREVH